MLNACLPLSLIPRIITYTFLKMLLHILKFKSKVIMAEKRFTWGKNYLLKMSKYFIPKERNNHLIATKSFYKECSLFPLLKYQSLFILRAETRGWRTNSSASFTRQSRVFFFPFLNVTSPCNIHSLSKKAQGIPCRSLHGLICSHCWGLGWSLVGERRSHKPKTETPPPKKGG